MSDGRSNRKSNVAQFIPQLEKDRLSNFEFLLNKAKTLRLEGLDQNDWDKPIWKITGGRLLKISARNPLSLTLNFHYSPKLGGEPIEGEWADLIKGLMVIRFHRYQQAVTNQRNFITAAGYLAQIMKSRSLPIHAITPELLDLACMRISMDYPASTAYNLHKAVNEFAGHCDANGLCKVLLDYKFSSMKRPLNTGGLDHKRLDDPETLTTEHEKLIDPIVFQILGELYRNVPKDHKYRFYILVLCLLAFTGRRFSEISLLPNQKLQEDKDGGKYLDYFPRKQTQGNVLTPVEPLYIPTQSLEILEPIIEEVGELCAAARETAEEMFKKEGPDLRWLEEIDDQTRLYKEDLLALGFPTTPLETTGWLRKNDLAHPDPEKLTLQGRKSANPFWYTNKSGLIKYCKKDYHKSLIEIIHIDQRGKKYFLKDLLLVRHMGSSSGFYNKWLATQCTHSMMTTFLRYFPDLAKEYASSDLMVNFTSHHFRHTLNTLLDEGGLSDLLQTEWFGRSNPRDTKAYQHTSPEKKALQIAAEIKAGKIGGNLAEMAMNLPINERDALLAARIRAVHDVGVGWCFHDVSQTPCPKSMQCRKDCDDYGWVKNDDEKLAEIKKTYAITFVNRQTFIKKLESQKPQKSSIWLSHSDKMLATLEKQLNDHGVENFDVEKYLLENNLE